MSSCSIPAPGRSSGFSPDEVIIYGISLTRRGVIAVAVTKPGTGYSPDTEVAFTPNNPDGNAQALPIINGGAITEIIVIDPGSYGAGAAPTVGFNNTGGGTGATAVAIMGNIGTLNLEEGRWNVGFLGLFDPRRDKPKRVPDFTIVAAYGYAYEGHCYRFDKPRLIGFEARGKDKMPDPIGCGFDPPSPPVAGHKWYEAWRLRSNERIIELGASVGRVEELVLDANRPGRRPPNTYASEMQLAHRGGRLTSQ